MKWGQMRRYETSVANTPWDTVGGDDFGDVWRLSRAVPPSSVHVIKSTATYKVAGHENVGALDAARQPCHAPLLRYNRIIVCSLSNYTFRYRRCRRLDRFVFLRVCFFCAHLVYERRRSWHYSDRCFAASAVLRISIILCQLNYDFLAIQAALKDLSDVFHELIGRVW